MFVSVKTHKQFRVWIAYKNTFNIIEKKKSTKAHGERDRGDRWAHSFTPKSTRDLPVDVSGGFANGEHAEENREIYFRRKCNKHKLPH